MAFQITNEVERNENMLPDLQIISSNIERMMYFEGFDMIRKALQAIVSWQETVFSLFDIPLLPDVRIYGSMGEGLAYPLSTPCERDIDMLAILKNNIAIENVYEKNKYASETRIYLIENVPSRPGYCYLCVINEGSLLMFPNTFISLTEEINGCQYFSGLALKEIIKSSTHISDAPVVILNIIRDISDKPNSYLEELDQQGPAMCIRFKAQLPISVTKCDLVFVVHCPHWPSSASDWVKRISRSGWPCQELKQKLAQEGIFLAPVGCKQDPYQQIQWRYSFNEAERQLVRSFNSTQAKCYVLLKRIISEYVKPWFNDDVISSYHLKTLMFWTIEETDFKAWVPANLVECIFLVLKRLAQCIEEENCPSYFIPTENLFQERATLENKEDLLVKIHYIISEGWLLLFRLPTFYMNYNVISTVDQYIWTERDVSYFIDWHQLYSSQMVTFVLSWYLAQLDIYQIHETGSIHSKFSEIINKLTLKVYSCRDEGTKELLKNVTARLCSSYGTQLLSLERFLVSDMSKNSRADEFAGEIYIEISCWRNQVDCLAKHANYAYMRGNFQSTISTAFNLLQRYLNLRVKAFSFDIPLNKQCDHFSQILNNIMRDIVEMFPTTDMSKYFDCFSKFFASNDVIFAKNEIYAVPGNAKVEMFKVGSEEDRLNPFSKFRQCLLVDPYFYVTFLAFQAYYDMGNQEATDTVIEIMEIICSEPPNSHLPTSLNLLGDCYLKTGQEDKAMEKFISSMKIKSWRNAAPWHIAILVWRQLLYRWSKTRDGDIKAAYVFLHAYTTLDNQISKI